VKAGKKAKAFLVQKTTRRLKEAGLAEEKKAKLEGLLKETKALDHIVLGIALLASALQNDENTWERVKEHVEVVAKDDFTELLNTPALVKEKKALLTEVKSFLAKIFHDGEQLNAEHVDEIEAIGTENSGTNGGAFFVESLNHGAQSELEDDDEGSESEDEEDFEGSLDKRPKKKNRLGQRARRELWEQKYGEKAKHVRKAKAEKLRARKQHSERTLVEIEEPKFKMAATPVAENANSNLHPSWAAKLAQKQRASNTGPAERIIFD